MAGKTLKRQADELGRGAFARLQPFDQPLHMHRRTFLQHRIHQRDADGPAHVAHQVEQRTGVRHFGFRPMIQCKPRCRQDACHHRHAAQNLRPEQPVEECARRHEAVGDQPRPEQREPEQPQPFWRQPRFHKCCHRRGDKLRNPRHDHDLADLKRVLPPGIAKEHRHQIGGAVKPDADGKTQ